MDGHEVLCKDGGFFFNQYGMDFNLKLNVDSKKKYEWIKN